MSWKNININIPGTYGVEKVGIEKVVGEFYVMCMTYMPNCQFRVKIIQDSYGKYLGRVNVAIKNSKDESPEWVGATGESIDEALENSINEFINSIQSSGRDLNNLTEEDFEWSAPEDF